MFVGVAVVVAEISVVVRNDYRFLGCGLREREVMGRRDDGLGLELMMEGLTLVHEWELIHHQVFGGQS